MDNFIVIATPIIKSLALAILTLVIGLSVIKRFSKFLEKQIRKSHLDDTLKPFISSFVSTSLKVLLVISVVKILGIDTTSFVAVLASAGLAIGLAFQGTLSNFAGGVLLLTLRPFKVGDYIEANGYSGTVESIQVLYTNIVTVDNKVIYVPNGNLSNASIVNYSVKDTRRVDLKFGVGYESDTKCVQEVLKEIVAAHALVLKDPEPFVRMSEHGDSAIVFTVRIWVNAGDYWSVYFDLIENVKQRFTEEEISIPYPQMDVHISK
jgi:small conductance mechanosensitive channel